jgi:hypothetical protein
MYIYNVAATCLTYDKVRQSVTSKSKSKTHGPITGSHLGRNGLIRACDWSMLSAFAFALYHFDALCHTLQVQLGGITAENLTCMARGRAPVHISPHQISKSNRVTGRREMSYGQIIHNGVPSKRGLFLVDSLPSIIHTYAPPLDLHSSVH